MARVLPCPRRPKKKITRGWKVFWPGIRKGSTIFSAGSLEKTLIGLGLFLSLNGDTLADGSDVITKFSPVFQTGFAWIGAVG